MHNQDYEKSLEYVNKGISFSTKESYMGFLPELLAQKSRILFNLGLIQEAHEAYEVCLNLYKLCRSQEEIQVIKNEIKNNFPQ